MADYTTHIVRKAEEWADAFELCVLTYDERFLRRKVIQTVHNESILVDLAHTTHLDHGDAFELTDGRFVEIIAAAEDLIEVTGANLPRLAWHIGNRHTPCAIEGDRLYIQRDHVLRAMLEQLGATCRDVYMPFTPEGGAYGHGRTHSHSHGEHDH